MICLLRLQVKEAAMRKPDLQNQTWRNIDGRYGTTFILRSSFTHLTIFTCCFLYLPHYLTLAERCFVNHGTFRRGDFALPIRLDTLLSWSAIFSLEIALKLKKSRTL